MPLVVPGINSNEGGNSQQSWMEKLAGKKIGDKHDSNVRVHGGFTIYLVAYVCCVWGVRLTHGLQSFAKGDLPKEHRVIEPGSMMTQDFNKDR